MISSIIALYRAIEASREDKDYQKSTYYILECIAYLMFIITLLTVFNVF